MAYIVEVRGIYSLAQTFDEMLQIARSLQRCYPLKQIDIYETDEYNEQDLSKACNSSTYSGTLDNFSNKLEIRGVQSLPGHEFSSFAILDFPADLTTFFQAVSRGSWEFSRKNGRYLLKLSNLPKQ